MNDGYSACKSGLNWPGPIPVSGKSWIIAKVRLHNSWRLANVSGPGPALSQPERVHTATRMELADTTTRARAAAALTTVRPADSFQVRRTTMTAISTRDTPIPSTPVRDWVSTSTPSPHKLAVKLMAHQAAFDFDNVRRAHTDAHAASTCVIDNGASKTIIPANSFGLSSPLTPLGTNPWSTAGRRW